MCLNPLINESSVTISEYLIPAFVSSTILSPTSLACLYFSAEQKIVVVDPIGASPMASVNTPIVFAVPYMEHVPHEKQMFLLRTENSSSVIASLLYSPIDSFKSGVTNVLSGVS